MKRRAIEPDERALWHEAMRGVARAIPAKKQVIAEPEIEKPAPPRAKAAIPAEPRPIIREPGPRRDDNTRATLHEPTPGLDRRQALRLKRGQLEIEARLDLHGMTQAEAHRELAGFIARSHAAGKRALLVVTGKGARSRVGGSPTGGSPTGVLRAAVPRWLAEPALCDRVLASAPAQPRDGGGGALYILLRRAR